MREILLTLQYICIIGLFVESLIIFRRLRNSLHLFLLISCICAFATNLGYLMEIMSDSEDNYILALKLSYAGRIWYAFFLFLFVARLCHRQVPKVVTAVLAIIHIFTFAVILDITGTTLYYSSYRFDTTGLFPKLYHGNGILHHIHMGLQVFYIVLGLAWLLIAFHREKKAAYRNRIGIIILAVLVEGGFFLIQLVGLTDHTKVYDFTMFGYFMGTVIMLIAIFSFDLLGTRELAREYMIDRISEGIIAVDNDGIVQFYNEPAKDLYPNITEKPDDTLNDIRNAIASGETITINDRIYSPEESELVYKGQNYGKVYAIVDDTDHFVYLEELEKEKDRADRANEAKSQFLANMSHEIRTPINAVLGMDEMILRETRESSIRSYAADIMAAGKALLALIGDILDLSKVEEGKMEIIPVQYELSSMINDLVNMIQGRADKKGLVFKITADEHVPDLLVGDEIRIRQCLLNLLTNAVKYTEKGSVIMDVSFDKKEENSVVLHFSVTDTGIGMRKEDMEALFSPYIRIEEKRNRTIEGTGLGMSITRKLLELMDSSLRVESEYGKGSRFSFDLCQEVVSWNEMGDYVQRYNSARDEAYGYQELFHAPKARILVVDDTEMNLTVIKNLLKKTGIQIDTVMSGNEALTLAETNDYDVMFIDHMMPDMDGIETL